MNQWKTKLSDYSIFNNKDELKYDGKEIATEDDEWADYVCETYQCRKLFKWYLEANPHWGLHKNLMTLRKNLLRGYIGYDSYRFVDTPIDELDYEMLHKYLQKMFAEPFAIEKMIYIKRAFAEGFTMRDIYAVREKYKTKLFEDLMKRLPRLVDNVIIERMKGN